MTARSSNPRIAGYCARLTEPIQIILWKPLSRLQVETLPPLPLPLVRGWRVEETAPAATPPSPPAQEQAPVPLAQEQSSALPATPAENAYQRLGKVPAQQIAPFLSHEHPQTIALILSQLTPAAAAGILAQMSSPLQAEVVYRLATLERVSSLVIQRLGEGLEISLRDLLEVNKKRSGPGMVANILDQLDPRVEEQVLTQLEAKAPEAAASVRHALTFGFADLVGLSDREIQILLRQVDQKDLVRALKTAADELKQKILNNMSERVKTFICEEMEFLGPMRLSEVETAQLLVVQQVRILQEQGEIAATQRDSEDRLV